MKMNEFASKNVAVLGLGIEGISLALFLSDKCASITLLDEKSEKDLISQASGTDSNLQALLGDSRYSKKLGPGYLDSLSGYDIIFRSPGVKYLLPELQKAMESGVEISSQIKLFFKLCPALIVGVTGTKGKGTTASLLQSILQHSTQQRATDASNDPAPLFFEQHTPIKRISFSGGVYLAGNIGVPAVSLLSNLSENDLVILELSSFQLQDLAESPKVSIITNLSADHLNYHHDLDEYQQAKTTIFRFQSPSDILIVNSKIDPGYYSEAKSSKVLFSGTESDLGVAKVEQSSSGTREAVIRIGDDWHRLASESELKLVGSHNLENICAAAIAATIFGSSLESIREAVKSFQGLPHRLELVSEIDGVKYYNDSFATNPEPSIAAVRSFRQNKILILGGSSKGADFSDLSREIVSNNVGSVILIGSEANNIEQSLRQNKYAGQIINSGLDLRTAVNRARQLSAPGEVVIMSPACASFDQFKNYKDRGDKFKEIVCSLKQDQS